MLLESQLSARAAAALSESDSLTSVLLDQDNECSGDAASCALVALQVRRGKRSFARMQANASLARGCDCSWTAGGANCGVNDGSPCWGVCCGCDCSWTAGGANCNANDGSRCWGECCRCDCSWTAGGANCAVNDGSRCWGECCKNVDTRCSMSGWIIAHSPTRCHMADGAAVISCAAKVGSHCGTRLSTSGFVGSGTHSIGIKAAPGAGVVTTFYLSNNGGLYDKTKTHPWVELDFEIMGHMEGSQSKIWTNMFTGVAVEHNQIVSVPFDVSTDYHIYAFKLSDTSIEFVVDGKTYRKEDIGHLPDVQASVRGSEFQKFISLWGKSSSEPPEGIPEFRADMGVLDGNTHEFPLYAGFKVH
eukprot:CAMPEP_0180434354 /NCGR_PEP_ID=MMETSP1036_2-20121128/9910_1 /TAXON_ID=632150 /ORGANISM="Azadinium spinosum, Strain 3D9" /LENGTH=359 /DNA_ID=CAMNT_0022440221 /DNA_START=93 /DNA_END=1172 /DNA_ORIENTATION=+